MVRYRRRREMIKKVIEEGFKSLFLSYILFYFIHSRMNSDAQVEINMFLRATEMNQANINLGGFFDVNRTLFKSVRFSR